MAVAGKRRVNAEQVVVPMVITSVFNENMKAFFPVDEGGLGKRRALNVGGTRSSKTYSILQLLVLLCEKATREKKPLIVSVVSESLPHLKIGCIRDFFNIIKSNEEDPKWSKTAFTYRFSEWAMMEFFGADDEGKARGPTRKILFINEADHVPWETARALDVRTELFTFLDWNPTGEFWAYEYVTPEGQTVPGWMSDPTSAVIKSTYKDALAVLPQAVVDNIESNRDKDPEWWQVYGLGELGNITGLVHPKFQQCDTMPAEGEMGYGLDFGFSGDQAALTFNVIKGDCLYSKQLIYKLGMTDDDMAREMDLLGVSRSLPIFADSAQPGSIEAIRRKGFNILPTEKGAGSVEYGIRKVNQYYHYWTKDSTDGIKEQRSYRFKRDSRTGRQTEIRLGADHLLDSRRYFVAGKRMGQQGDMRTLETVSFSGSYRGGYRIEAGRPISTLNFRK